MGIATEVRKPLVARLLFYYGWVVLVVAALAMTGTMPGRTHGLGLITVVHFAFPKAFGRAHLGQIQGFFQVLSVITSALGPLVLAIAAVFVPMPIRPPLAPVPEPQPEASTVA